MRKYTEEQITWLKSYAPTHYIEDILKEFNKEFNKNISYNAMYHLIRSHNIPTLLKDRNKNLLRKQYTDKHVDWIRKHFNNYSRNDLRLLFNKTFNFNFSSRYFNTIIWEYKINPTKAIRYEKEYLDYIYNNYKKYINNDYLDYKSFLKQFNKTFNVNVKYDWIYNAFKLKLHITPPKTYQQGMYNPIGHEKLYGGEYYVKVTNYPARKSSYNHIDEVYNYRRKSHILYEQYYNIQINDDTHIVIHLDDNKNNFTKENLYLISRKAFHIYNGSKYNNQTLETKINALKLSELQQLLKEI